MNKVIRGTPLHTDDICKDCRNLQRMRGRTLSEEQRQCEVFGMLTFPVTECNKYDDAKVPHPGTMDAIAWRMVADKKGKIRFVNYQEYRRLQMNDELY